jgi:hypothetical protein
MQNGAKDRKVGVVTFNNEVNVLGDGTKDPQTITGDKLNNFEWLTKNGAEKSSELLSKTVKETGKYL